MNGDVSILIKISLKFIPEGLIQHIQALIQIIVWHGLDYQRIYASFDLNELNGTLIQTVQSNLALVKPTLRNRVLSLVV